MRLGLTKQLHLILWAAWLLIAGMAAHAGPTAFRYMTVDGIKIFYREAGDPRNPTILLLHGFPTSSHMFRDLIPELSDHFHLVAPDYPGMGYSEAPGRRPAQPAAVSAMASLSAQDAAAHFSRVGTTRPGLFRSWYNGYQECRSERQDPPLRHRPFCAGGR